MPREHLFVLQSPYDWRIVHVTDMPDDQCYPVIMPQLYATADGSHIYVTTEHHWTEEDVLRSLDNWSESYENLNENIEITFI
jgi:hypothetical protein